MFDKTLKSIILMTDDTPASEGHASREDTPSTIDRRMTLIAEEIAAAGRNHFCMRHDGYIPVSLCN